MTNSRRPSFPPDVDLPGFLRAADLEARGIPRAHLQRMRRRGELERVSRGVYRRLDADITELETVIAVSKRIPHGIICLLTALTIHEIGTQLPWQVWIAIDRKARKPHVPDLPIKVVRFSGVLLRYGIEAREVLGVPIRITTPARTVVDCFRYRNKIGLDVALEALREAWRERKVTLPELDRAARIARVERVMRPYVDAVVA